MLLSRWRYYLSSIPTLLLGVRNWPRMLAAFLASCRPSGKAAFPASCRPSGKAAFPASCRPSGKAAFPASCRPSGKAAFLHLPVASPFVLELRNGCRFWVRTPMDIWIIKEICLDHQYELASVEFEDGWTVLDIGAGLGDFAVTMARKNPHGKIYAYEPFPPSHALLQENLRLNAVTNVVTSPLAIAAQAGSAQMHIASEAVAHSTVSAAENADHSWTPVQTVTLDQVFASRQIARCDYLKMDCEGAEYSVFFHTSAATLQSIRHVCLEYHDNLTEHSHQDLVQLFTRHGFRVRLTPCPAYRHLGLLYAENKGIKHGDTEITERLQ